MNTEHIIGAAIVNLPPIQQLDVADNVVHHLTADGAPKEGERKPGDLLMVEYPGITTFFEVTERHDILYKTSVKRL